MAEPSVTSDPRDTIQEVLQEVDQGSTPADSAFTENTSVPNQAESSPVVEKPSPKKKPEGTSGRKVRGKKSAKRSPVGTRSVARKNPGQSSKLPSVSESESPVDKTSGEADDKSDTPARRALWVGEMASSSGSGGAFVSIIAKYTMDFGGNPTPKIPLCRLVPFCRVRNYQTTSHMTEALKRSFETHCYMEHGAGFHVCPFDGSGKELFVTDADRDEWDMLSSHATVQYDWIQDAERCYQVLSTPLSEYKEMIGDEVYEEFEKSHLKTLANHRPWYSENMTAAAAAYILSYAEITVAKEANRATEEEEERKNGEALSAVEKKDRWDEKVKEVSGPWQAMVFKYATITNPMLGPDFMATVRELHNTIAKQEKKEREVTYSVGVDRVKAFASAGIHTSLKLELLRAHYSPVEVRTKYHHPPKHDVDIDIRPWLAQWSLWTKKQKEARQIFVLSKADNVDGDGQTPAKKSRDKQKQTGSGRSSKSGQKKAESEAPARKGKKKKPEPEPEPENTHVEMEGTEPNDTSPIQTQEPSKEKDPDDQEPQPKRMKKQKWHDGLERKDIIISLDRPLVVVNSSLQDTYEKIEANKRRIPKLPVPIIDELKALCGRIKDQRASGHCINNARVASAADCQYLDMPTGYKLSEDGEVPSWNMYPKVDLPRQLMNLGRSILDNRGCIIIVHPGTLRSTQQIADALDTSSMYFKQITSFVVHNEEVQIEPLRNMKVFHSKVEVFCKIHHDFVIPKMNIPAFDEENSGRDATMIVNFNSGVAKRTGDGGRSKCVGFVQTLLENFTGHGDIVIDFVGGWGATLLAAHNCSRCCIAAETREEALKSLHHQVKLKSEKKTVGTSSRDQTGVTQEPVSRGKKPLTEEDDLGDDFLGDE
ncbi:hypothetical protein R1sor_015790 [Riccia sorocarpa]|uniref:Uncharacterized protein n=1 Tax=Riccia sorocarpa TaxID=122646 RepID=A0ABD3HF60_9MARC